MVHVSLFDKEPGTGLPQQVENIGRSALEVVRPQLGWIREHFFSGPQAEWPDKAFNGFIRFPLVAGYILGLVGTYLSYRKLQLTEADVLKCVIDVSNHFLANEHDAEIALHYMMQQSSFKFGLDIGTVDVTTYLEEKRLIGQAQYVRLAAISQLFLTYTDVPTLKLNLQIFCDLHGVPRRDDSTLDEIVERWDIQKQYEMSCD